MSTFYEDSQVELSGADIAVLQAVVDIAEIQRKTPFCLTKPTSRDIIRAAKKHKQEIPQPAITLNKLVNLGLLSQTEDPAKPASGKLFFLTDAGRRVLDENDATIDNRIHPQARDYNGPLDGMKYGYKGQDGDAPAPN